MLKVGTIVQVSISDEQSTRFMFNELTGVIGKIEEGREDKPYVVMFDELTELMLEMMGKRPLFAQDELIVVGKVDLLTGEYTLLEDEDVVEEEAEAEEEDLLDMYDIEVGMKVRVKDLETIKLLEEKYNEDFCYITGGMEHLCGTVVEVEFVDDDGTFGVVDEDGDDWYLRPYHVELIEEELEKIEKGDTVIVIDPIEGEPQSPVRVTKVENLDGFLIYNLQGQGDDPYEREELKLVRKKISFTHEDLDQPFFKNVDVKVIVNEPATVVYITTGDGKSHKGVAKCDEMDAFDLETGLDIATLRAVEKLFKNELKKIQKDLEALTK